jgi:hypothetical protein
MNVYINAIIAKLGILGAKQVAPIIAFVPQDVFPNRHSDEFEYSGGRCIYLPFHYVSSADSLAHCEAPKELVRADSLL